MWKWQIHWSLRFHALNMNTYSCLKTDITKSGTFSHLLPGWHILATLPQLLLVSEDCELFS